jgi:hypothetical protein
MIAGMVHIAVLFSSRRILPFGVKMIAIPWYGEWRKKHVKTKLWRYPMRNPFSIRARVKIICIALLCSAAVIANLPAQSERPSGTVEKVSGADIIVKYRSVNRPFAMGEKFYLRAGAARIAINATFPMQTVSKCRLASADAAHLREIKKGMIVYYEIPPAREEPLPPAPEKKTGLKNSDNGTITDSRTGLVWLKNAGTFKGSWDSTVKYCEDLDAGGFQDWRLPTRLEFESLMTDYPREEDWVYLLENSGFANVKSGYWTASAEKLKDEKWYLVADRGMYSYTSPRFENYAFPVRGTMSVPDVAPYFTDNGDGSITDTRTGLVWLKNANIAGGTFIWDRAGEYCGNVNAAGHRDWRLPTRTELQSLVAGMPRSQSIWKKALNGAKFENVQDEYWSQTDATTYASAEMRYNLDLKNDYISRQYVRKQKLSVWPVRGERVRIKTAEPFFIDNGNGTITDTRSGLIWSTTSGFPGGEWSEALSVASKSRFAGHDDWRAAGVADIRSLLKGMPGDIDPKLYLWFQGFSGFSEEYWLSSEYAPNTDAAWYFSIAEGALRCESKDRRHSVWIVRGGKEADEEVSPFEKKGDALVDIRSNLMWLENANISSGPVTMKEAAELCAKLNAGGYSDWRLPTRGEFIALLAGMEQFKDSSKAFTKQGFTGIQPNYWTSTPFEKKEGDWHFASMSESMCGDLFHGDGNARYAVWPVRNVK